MLLEIETRESIQTGVDSRDAYQEDIDAMRDAILRFKQNELPEDEFKRFRLHRGIYGQRADQKGFNMVRVKVPYGLLDSRQLVTLAGIARDYSDGFAHVTTRQDVQLHWVRLEAVPDVMEKLNQAGLTTREACGNTVRNIVGSPPAGVSRDELFDVTPYAHLLASHLLRNSLNQTLPRKFKISFSGSSDERDGIIPWIHDIGYVAAIEASGSNVKRGFRVFVGGGLGAQPRVADLLEEFIPVEWLIPTTEAILSIFNEFGNREKRDKARMKYVLWQLGFAEFKQKVGELRSGILAAGRTFPEPDIVDEGGYLPLDSPTLPATNGDVEFNRWLHSNVFSQKQTGYNVVYVNPTIGDITVDQLLALSRIAENYSNGTVRTTPQQDMVLRWIRSSDIHSVYNELKSVGLNQPGAQQTANVTSCPGADTCNLGITHSRALGRELTLSLQRQPDWSELLGGVRIKISGCMNSCGQHHVAAIGFHGATKNVEGGEIPSYIVSISGGMNSGRYNFGKTLGRVPSHYAAEAALRIIKRFISERIAGENFWQLVERIGVRPFRDAISDLADVRPEKITEELFVDIGESTKFAAVTGEGECAV